MHVVDLSAQATAIVILRTTVELIVELVKLRAQVSVLAAGMTIRTVATELPADVVQHPVKVIDAALKSATAPALVIDRLLNDLLLVRILNVFFVFMRGRSESETGNADGGGHSESDKFFHMVDC